MALADHGCRVSCTGLYADVGFTQDNLLSPVIPPDVVSLMKNVDILASAGECFLSCHQFSVSYSGMESKYTTSGARTKMASILDSPSTADRFEERSTISKLLKEYETYKRNYAENIRFEPTAANLSITICCR